MDIRLHILIPVLGIACLCAIQTNAATTAPFVQDRFAIGLWVDPPPDAHITERYRELADANFTFVICTSGKPDIIKKQLRLCRKFGMKAIIAAPAVPPAQWPDGPACWGYGLRDEPNVNGFAELRTLADALRTTHPGRFPYVNLFPNYANAQQMGVDTYAEYVNRFCDTFQPEVLSMDHYPTMKPGADSRESYCSNLEVMREQSLRRGIPFWNFFNCMPFGPHADPTESQLRWQIYTSLAYGAKGVMYFCYYTPFSPEFPKGGAIILRDDRRTRHYDEAKRINAALRNLGPTLMKLTSTAVIRVKPEDVPAKALAGSPVKDMTRADYDPAHDFMIGVFRHTDGRRAVLMNNYRHDFSAWPTVVFDAPADTIREISKETGKEIPVLDDSPDMPGLQLSFDSGEGRLFLMP